MRIVLSSLAEYRKQKARTIHDWLIEVSLLSVGALLLSLVLLATAYYAELHDKTGMP